MELGQRALQTLDACQVPVVAGTLAGLQELGAWLLDCCFTETRVRAGRARWTVQYTVVPNALFGLIRPHLPSGRGSLLQFKDENLGNVVEAAASCMLLQLDWDGIRGLSGCIAQLDEQMAEEQRPVAPVALQALAGGTTGKSAWKGTSSNGLFVSPVTPVVHGDTVAVCLNG
jgi:hypothetical protein